MMPSFFTAIHRVARKQHRCGECSGTIKPLDVYERATGCWDGAIDTFKTCQPCEIARDDLVATCLAYNWAGEDGALYMFCGVEEDLLNAAAEVKEPGETFKLLRHVVGMRKRRAETRRQAVSQQ